MEKILKTTAIKDEALKIYKDFDSFASGSYVLPTLQDKDYLKYNFLENLSDLADKMVLPSDTVSVSQADYESAIAVFEKLKNLTPVDASLPNLWITLNLTVLYDYMRGRWLPDSVVDEGEGEEEELTEEEKQEKAINARNNKIKNRFLGQHTPLTRVGVAGFWWMVYLTRMEDREDPYELTKILFENTDFRTLRFGESSLIRLRPAMIGILSFLKEHDDIRQGLSSKGQYISKLFNKLGTFIHLDYFDEEYFKSQLERRITEIDKINSTKDVQNHPELFSDLSSN